MKNYLLIIITIISIWIYIGLLEAYIVYTYQSSINKTSYENYACIFTIIKSTLNISNGIYLFCVYIKKKENKYWKILKPLNILTYITNVLLFTNLKKYGRFISIIMLEFIMYVTMISIMSITTIIILFLCINNKNKPICIGTYPQLAVPVDNSRITNINIPEATPVNFNED